MNEDPGLLVSELLDKIAVLRSPDLCLLLDVWSHTAERIGYTEVLRVGNGCSSPDARPPPWRHITRTQLPTSAARCVTWDGAGLDETTATGA